MSSGSASGRFGNTCATFFRSCTLAIERKRRESGAAQKISELKLSGTRWGASCGHQSCQDRVQILAPIQELGVALFFRNRVFIAFLSDGEKGSIGRIRTEEIVM